MMSNHEISKQQRQKWRIKTLIQKYKTHRALYSSYSAMISALSLYNPRVCSETTKQHSFFQRNFHLLHEYLHNLL